MEVGITLRFSASYGKSAIAKASRSTYSNPTMRARSWISIQQAYGEMDGIVINPAAYTHTSVAILDALKAVRLPAVEVHLSNVSEREPFRQISYAGMACVKTYAGLGFEGYERAILFLKDMLSGCSSNY